MSSVFVEQWHDHPVLIGLLAERVARALGCLGPSGELARQNGELLLIVSAHSLPVRVVAGGDPYAEQLRRTGELVAQASGLDRFEIGWQSAGRTPEPWLGPDILERLRALPGEGVRAVVVCPAGFTSDHLEVLYDLDVEARQLAEELGLAFARTESLNAEPRISRLSPSSSSIARGALSGEPGHGGRRRWRERARRRPPSFPAHRAPRSSCWSRTAASGERSSRVISGVGGSTSARTIS